MREKEKDRGKDRDRDKKKDKDKEKDKSRSRSRRRKKSKSRSKSRKRKKSRSRSKRKKSRSRSKRKKDDSREEAPKAAADPAPTVVTKRRGLGGFDSSTNDPPAPAASSSSSSALAAAVSSTAALGAAAPVDDRPRQVAAKGAWAQFVTGAGVSYFHNVTTGETTWQRPLDFDAPASRRHGNEAGGETSLFVFHLPGHWSEADLETHFKPFGTLLRTTVQRGSNGLSRGFGFVAYARSEEASMALSSMNGFQVEGKKLKVSLKTGASANTPGAAAKEQAKMIATKMPGIMEAS